ncbi:MAG: rod shape-determining protein MreC [Bdellovibrio sp.]|nr:MAG: rod shape-determining protein MreC [Bdellovibrio sp.]
MSFFALDMKKLIIGLLIVTFTIIALNTEFSPSRAPFFLKPFAYLAQSIQNAYAHLSSGVEGTFKLYFDLIDIKKQNRQLLKENASLKAQLGALTELQLENQRLNRLLQFQQRSSMQLLAAKVIGRDLIPDHQSITINRGSKDGIKVNMGVITEGGIVGYILRVNNKTATVLLLTDRYSAIDAIVQRSRARGIVRGFTSDTCLLDFLQRSDDVVNGDLIVSSGFDQAFPKGFPIGTVFKVKKSRYGASQEVYLHPIINPFTLEEVFIILNPQQKVAKKDER